MSKAFVLSTKSRLQLSDLAMCENTDSLPETPKTAITFCQVIYPQFIKGCYA